MRRPMKSAAAQRFDQTWELFCILLPNAAPPIVAELRNRALLAAGVVQGQDITDEQAIYAMKVIDRLNGEIADYRRACHTVVDVFRRSVTAGEDACTQVECSKALLRSRNLVDPIDWRGNVERFLPYLTGQP